MVCLGLVTAWRLATWPTRRSPSLVKATTEGVVRPPSALGMTTGSPPSMTATTELVVPRSIPMILEAMSTPDARVLRRTSNLPSAWIWMRVSKCRTVLRCRFGTSDSKGRVTWLTTSANPLSYAMCAVASGYAGASAAPRWIRGYPTREEAAMLWTIFVILLVLWLLGVVTSYTLGGFIHVLLVIAVIMAIMQLIQGRRAL